MEDKKLKMLSKIEQYQDTIRAVCEMLQFLKASYKQDFGKIDWLYSEGDKPQFVSDIKPECQDAKDNIEWAFYNICLAITYLEEADTEDLFDAFVNLGGSLEDALYNTM